MVSANKEIINMHLKGKKNISHTASWYLVNSLKSKLLITNKQDIIIKTKLTSYEIIWATDRRLPNKA